MGWGEEGRWWFRREGGKEIMAEGVGGVILKVSCLISLKGRLFRRWIKEGGIMM